MSTIACQYDNCGLHFVNKYELIFHIEEDHLPGIEQRKNYELEEIKQLFKDTEKLEDTLQHQTAQEKLNALYNQTMPLSLLLKLNPFSKGHRVSPVNPKQITMNFCHYRKRVTSSESNLSNSLSNKTITLNQNETQNFSSNFQSSPLKNKKFLSQENSSKIAINVNSLKKWEEKLPQQTQSNIIVSSEERRFHCDVEGCKKAYKNQQGLKAHIRNAHNAIMLASNNSAQRLSPTEESILSRQLPNSTQLTPSPLTLNNSKLTNYTYPSSSSSTLSAPCYVVTTSASLPLHSEQSSTENVMINIGTFASVSTGVLQPAENENHSQVQNSSFYEGNAPSTNGLTTSAVMVRSGGTTAETPSNYVIVSTSGIGNISNAVPTVRQVVQSTVAMAVASGNISVNSGNSSGAVNGPPTLIMHSQQSQRLLPQRSVTTGKFQCQYCPKSYKTVMYLNKHIQDSHPKKLQLSGASFSSQQQLLSSNVLFRSQSPRTINGNSANMSVKQTLPIGGRASTIMSQQGRSTTPLPSQQGQSVTLVAATPPPPQLQQQQLLAGYTIPKHSAQSSQQYYVAVSPVNETQEKTTSPSNQQQHAGQEQRSQIRTGNQYVQQSQQQTLSPYSSPNSQQQTTTIYVSQQQSPIQLQQYAVTHTSQPQQQVKWMSWSETNNTKQTRSDFQIANNNSTLFQNTAIVVGRNVNNGQRQNSQNRLYSQNLQSSQTQQISSASSQGGRQQYYQERYSGQQQPQYIVANAANGSGSNSGTTTIRVSSLNQFNHQQLHSGQQYVQIQQQPNSYSHHQSQQPQIVQTVISSQTPLSSYAQQQMSNPSNFVVRTSQLHNSNSTTRYVTQQQYTSAIPNENNTTENISSLQQSSFSRSLNVLSPSSSGTVYYRGTLNNNSLNSGQQLSNAIQQVSLRSSIQQPSQNSSMRMIAVCTNGYNAQTSQYHYQSGAGQSKLQISYTPTSLSHSSRRGGGRYGNVVLQSVQQHQQLSTMTNDGTYIISQPQSSLNSSSTTAAAFANADPSTPIRAIVSRGLAEQVTRHNMSNNFESKKNVSYTNRDGETGRAGTFSYHYRNLQNSSLQQQTLQTNESKINEENSQVIEGFNEGDTDFRDAPKLQPQTTISFQSSLQEGPELQEKNPSFFVQTQSIALSLSESTTMDTT